jgi:hypothetical protein
MLRLRSVLVGSQFTATTTQHGGSALNYYLFCNTTSGAFLGCYPGEDLMQAIAAMYQDAGVADGEWDGQPDDLDAEILTAENIEWLGTICTRSEDGRHFVEIYPDDWLHRMECAGLIIVDRPVHHTGIPWSHEDWTVQVSDRGQEIVDGRVRQ